MMAALLLHALVGGMVDARSTQVHDIPRAALPIRVTTENENQTIVIQTRRPELLARAIAANASPDDACPVIQAEKNLVAMGCVTTEIHAELVDGKLIIRAYAPQ